MEIPRYAPTAFLSDAAFNSLDESPSCQYGTGSRPIVEETFAVK
jgi:hypothetical protein